MAVIDSLWVQRTAAGTGAIVGALVGIVPGVALARQLCGLAEGDCAGTRLLLGALGAGSGALFGAGIGGQIRRWELHYAGARPAQADVGLGIDCGRVLVRVRLEL